MNGRHAVNLRAAVGLLLFGVALLLPLGMLRQNRITAGLPLYFGAVFGRIWPLYIAAFLLILALYALREKQKRLLIWTVLPYAMSLVPTLALALLSRTLSMQTFGDSGAARVALSSGFWVLLGAVLLVQSDAGQAGRAIILTFALPVLAASAGILANLALYKEYLNYRTAFYAQLGRHLSLALSSVAVSVIPGILLGYWCHRSKRAREWIMGVVNLFQVAPTLSLLALVMIPLTLLSKRYPFLADLGIRGVGFAPAFIVLTLYCLLPITANAHAGFDQVEASVVDSAKAMGMTKRQIFTRVLFPLSLPVLIAGVRTALTQNISNTILAGLIGGGGMGALIFLGLAQSASDLILLGSIPVILMALLCDAAFKAIEHNLVRKAGVGHDSPEQSREIVRNAAGA